MTEQDHDFSPELVDRQIVQPDPSLSTGSRRLVEEIQHDYRAYAEQNKGSLANVWQRLEQSQGRAASPRVAQIVPIEQARNDQKGKQRMSQNIAVGAAQRNRWLRPLSILAAVVVAALLIGSTVLVLTHANRGKNPEARSTTNTASAPAAASGLYIVTAKPGKNQISKVDKQTHAVIWSSPVEELWGYTVQDGTIYASSVKPDPPMRNMSTPSMRIAASCAGVRLSQRIHSLSQGFPERLLTWVLWLRL